MHVVQNASIWNFQRIDLLHLSPSSLPDAKEEQTRKRKRLKTFSPQAENELRLSQSEFDRQVKKQQEAKWKKNWNEDNQIKRPKNYQFECKTTQRLGGDHEAADGRSLPKPNQPPPPPPSRCRSSGEHFSENRSYSETQLMLEAIRVRWIDNSSKFQLGAGSILRSSSSRDARAEQRNGKVKKFFSKKCTFSKIAFSVLPIFFPCL